MVATDGKKPTGIRKALRLTGFDFAQNNGLKTLQISLKNKNLGTVISNSDRSLMNHVSEGSVLLNNFTQVFLMRRILSL
jgi:hypothetical protein